MSHPSDNAERPEPVTETVMSESGMRGSSSTDSSVDEAYTESGTSSTSASAADETRRYPT